MIKKLLLTAALLAPGLAYGQVSASLDPPVTPGGQDPAVPAPAANAGLTTLAANFDFVNNQMCVYDGRSPACVAASPLSNWLDCVGTDATKIWHRGWPGSTTTVACDSNAISLQTDQGKTVLVLHYNPSYGNLGLTGNNDSVSIQTITNGTGNGTPTFVFPQGFYYEATYRIGDANSNPAGSSYQNSVWSWQIGSCTVDMQLAELFTVNGGGNHAGGGAGGWCPANDGGQVQWVDFQPNNLPPGYARTDYHKYGGLRTHNGSTSMPACMFVDDILMVNNYGGSPGGYCQPNQLQTDNTIFSNRTWSVAWIASSDSFYNAPRPTTDDYMYLQYIRVWSCASWPTHDCRGTTEYNDGNLIYWH